MQTSSKTVQLYSGGLDSYLIRYLWQPDVTLFFDIGTEQNKVEKEYLPKGTIIKKINLSEYVENDGILTIPLRNLLFLTLAVNYGDVICLGGVSTDVHYDKTFEFIESTEKLFNSVLQKEASKRKIKIRMPYKLFNKQELLTAYYKKGGDIKAAYEQSMSCHFPINKKPCKQCLACRRKEEAFLNFSMS